MENRMPAPSVHPLPTFEFGGWSDLGDDCHTSAVLVKSNGEPAVMRELMRLLAAELIKLADGDDDTCLVRLNVNMGVRACGAGRDANDRKE